MTEMLTRIWALGDHLQLWYFNGKLTCRIDLVRLLQGIVQIHRRQEDLIDLLHQEEIETRLRGEIVLLLQEVEIYQLMEEVILVLDRTILIEEKMTEEIEEDRETVVKGEEMMILVGNGSMIDKIENTFYC